MTAFADQLRRFAQSPAAFRESLLIDSDAGPVPLGSVMNDWQRRDFEAMDSAWRRAVGYETVNAGPQKAYLERPRGHSKTGDLAIQVTWALAFSTRPISGVAAAADKQQARLLRNAVNRLIATNPWLGDQLDVMHSSVRNRKNGSELEILSSDAPTSYGRTPDFVCIDEFVH